MEDEIATSDGAHPYGGSRLQPPQISERTTSWRHMTNTSAALRASRMPSRATRTRRTTCSRRRFFVCQEHAAGHPPDNVLAWLYRVCSNLATSRGRRGVVARRFVQHAAPPADEVAAEVEVLRRDMGEALVAALGILTDDAKTALIMAANGYSGREIADALGRTETATRTLMFRARERLGPSS